MSSREHLDPVPEDRFGIVGRVIAGAYRVERVVAEGGFGVVYRAHHSGFRAPIALKCLKVPQQLGAEYQARFLERFRAEAEVMFRLSANLPSVVRPLHVDAMTTPSGAFVPFIVLEWLEGETLDAIIRRRRAARKPPLSLHEVLELLEPAALALARAHRFDGPRGKETIVHCDVKPENVFVAEAGGERVVKVLDFGVANVRSAASGAGADGVALFTPAYGAPEQWDPATFGELGPWTDVWGLALCAVEALVGEPVITGDHARILKQVLDRGRRPTPRTHGVAVADSVETVFAQALAVDPRARPRDAGSFWKALEQAVHDAEAAASAELLPVVIPDLVPVSRSPRALESNESGAHRFDFDEAPGTGPELALDLPTGEPLHRRSLSPPSVSIPAPLSQAARGRESAAPTSPARAPGHSPPPPGTGRSSSWPPASPPSDRLRASPAPAGRPNDANISLAPASLPSASRARIGAVHVAPNVPSSPPSLVRRLLPGIAMAVASVVLTVLAHGYAALSGEVFSIGPLRTTWIAALLLLGGLGFVAVRLAIRDQGER